MQAGVPTTTPAVVSVSEADCAMPKSNSLTPSCTSMTLPGLRSRWMIPAACAAVSASASCMVAVRASASVSGPRSSRSSSVWPPSSSVTSTGWVSPSSSGCST